MTEEHYHVGYGREDDRLRIVPDQAAATEYLRDAIEGWVYLLPEEDPGSRLLRRAARRAIKALTSGRECYVELGGETYWWCKCTSTQCPGG